MLLVLGDMHCRVVQQHMCSSPSKKRPGTPGGIQHICVSLYMRSLGISRKGICSPDGTAHVHVAILIKFAMQGLQHMCSMSVRASLTDLTLACPVSLATVRLSLALPRLRSLALDSRAVRKPALCADHLDEQGVTLKYDNIMACS